MDRLFPLTPALVSDEWQDRAVWTVSVSSKAYLALVASPTDAIAVELPCVSAAGLKSEYLAPKDAQVQKMRK